jgi:hypothetical protein
MADSAALLIDEVLPHQPMRQWVLSVFRGQFTYFPRVYLYPTGLNDFLRRTKEFIASAIYSAKH